HIEDKLWKGFFDAIFGLASILLAIFFGAALGNVVRGVPLQTDGFFFEPLWTNWRVGEQNGILDWYTVICGVVALVTLTVHGSLYLATKTEGGLNLRARSVAYVLWPVQVLLTGASLMKWEFPRLCRGGSQTLRIPGVYLPLLPSFCRSPLPREPRAVAVASAFQRLRSGPFEGPATVKPPALPEDTYFA